MQPLLYEAATHRNGKPGAAEPAPAALKAEFPKLDSVTLWLALFVFGGGLLFLYYSEIGYFPEVSWQDALTYIALMAILGGSLLLAYSALLFVPGAIWSKYLISDDWLGEYLTMENQSEKPCVWSIVKRILFPFALFMAFCHGLFFLQPDDKPAFVVWGAAASLIAVSGLLQRDFSERLRMPDPTCAETGRVILDRTLVAICHVPLLVLFVAQVSVNPNRGDLLWISRIFAILPLASFIWPLYKRFENWRKRDPKEVAKQVADQWSLLCRALLAFGSAALFSLAALWFFHWVYKRPEAYGATEETLWGLLLLCTLVVIVANLIVSVIFHEHHTGAFLASFLAAFLLLGAGHFLGERLPAKFMKHYGFGMQSANLVLTERGGRILCQQAISVEFEKLPTTSQSEPKNEAPPSSAKPVGEKRREEGPLARVANVTILSRLGSEYLLRFPDGKKLVLPKEEVVSWSANSTSPEIKDNCLGSSESAARQGAPDSSGQPGGG